MDMPKSIKVGPHTYTVLRKPAAVLGDSLGHADMNLLQIHVRQRLRKSKAQEILLHEVVHCCTYPALSDDNKHFDEQFVETVSHSLLPVLQENPQLVEYLTK